MVRWLQLCNRCGSSAQKSETSVLLLHDEDDAMCSCPREDCAGGQLTRDSFLRFIDFVSDMLRTSIVLPLLLWTPMVSLANEGFWTSWCVTGFVAALIWLVVVCPFALHRERLPFTLGPARTSCGGTFTGRSLRLCAPSYGATGIFSLKAPARILQRFPRSSCTRAFLPCWRKLGPPRLPTWTSSAGTLSRP
ncbi:hypothetical protein DFJ74DRAFT_675222 [Hyaloraphidium curvatum]|nr:hypothetical protein DFJ74DRAFT_675222 [Hyaloraphidium curvatum]